MNNKLTKTILISIVAVLVLAIGVIGVFAQNDDAAPADQTSGVDYFRGHGRGGFPDGDREGRDAELAEALGITVEELQAAQQEVHEARIAQMVEDGVLTLDQANLMLAMDALKGYVDREALMAEVLGLSLEEFEAAREDGSLRDLLATITPAELQEKTQAALEEALQQAVDDNVITSEQADLVREQMEEGVGFGFHHGFGGHARPGGFGGRGMHGYSVPDETQNSSAPSV
jgi:hypothetical protein